MQRNCFKALTVNMRSLRFCRSAAIKTVASAWVQCNQPRKAKSQLSYPEPVAFTNWFWHQPDNYDGNGHFGRFRQVSDQPGIKWDDARHVSTARGYLVEFEGSSIQK